MGIKPSYFNGGVKYPNHYSSLSKQLDIENYLTTTGYHLAEVKVNSTILYASQNISIAFQNVTRDNPLKMS